MDLPLDKKFAKRKITIREHADDLLKCAKKLWQLGYLDAHIYKLLKICCEYHDYGKMNDEFQKRVSSLKRFLFDDSKEVAHNVLSLCFLYKDQFESLEDYHRTCYAVLNHHHYTNNFDEVRKKRELIKAFADQFGGKKIGLGLIEDLKELKQKNDTEAIRLKGLLHKCDFSASGGYEIEYPNDFLIDSLNNNLLADWKRSNPDASWNELQHFCLDHQDENMIAIANTGMGKTEAGLLWIGDNKGFFILPLRTAINAIYDRVAGEKEDQEKGTEAKGILLGENLDTRVSLLHSDSLAYYLGKAEGATIEEDDVLDYNKKGKSLSMPLTISTLDQLFNFVYKYNGFELKLATLGYSKIVIDEIQAYSPDLLAYLVAGLEAIVEMGGKFAILTATLPPFIKDYLEENIGEIKLGKFTKGKTRHHLKVLERGMDLELIANHFKEKGGKTLIICNTVKKSQEVYDDLAEKFGIEKVRLIHAKFTKEDRKTKEDEIIEFGETQRTGDEIWVATSVVEASLDIDFDYLFTELNDLNGLFQRLGRVNRKGKKEQMLDEANCYVFTEINDGILTNKDGSKGFIDRVIYGLSKEAVLGWDGLLPEEKKVELIEETLTTENVKGSTFDRKYRKHKKYVEELYPGQLKLSDSQLRDIVSFNIIPGSVYEENRAEIEELRKQMDDKESDYLKQVKAREKLASFTVSVGMYDLSKADRQRAMKDEFIVVRCKYDSQRGFERDVVEEDGEEKGDMFL